MKSIKPGRGPSRQSAVMSVFMAIFGVIWTVIAILIGSNMGIGNSANANHRNFQFFHNVLLFLWN